MRPHPIANPLPGPEPLEGRYAPAAVTYTDVDGDQVTVRTSKGTNAQLTPLLNLQARGVGQQLLEIDLNQQPGVFAGTDVSVTVRRAGQGDGLAAVGFISAGSANGGTPIDLGRVAVAGDLGRIEAGDATLATPAVAALMVRSMGRYGTDTQAAGGSRTSTLNGALGAFAAARDVVGAFLNVQGGTAGTIGRVVIGGSLAGQGTDTFSGGIQCSGDMGPVRIARDLVGAGGAFSGSVQSLGKLAGLFVGGSILGSTGPFSGYAQSSGDMGLVLIGGDLAGGQGSFSGYVQSLGKLVNLVVGGSVRGGTASFSGYVQSSDDLGAIHIARDLAGGAGSFSGYVQSGGKLVNLVVGGSVRGGTASFSGYVQSGGDMGAIRIGGDLAGGSITGTASTLDQTGYVQSGGRLGSLFVGGSVVAGTDTSTNGQLTKNASVRAGANIGSVTVLGSLVGSQTANGFTPVVISARGPATPPPGSDLAIGQVTVGGRVEYARILAGYDTSLNAANPDAQVGAVTVGGDWAASDLVAGGTDGGDGFGNANDTKITGADPDAAATVSRIGRLTVGGVFLGTPDSVSNSDRYGIVAQQVGAVTVRGRAIPHTPGPANDTTPIPLGLTGDITIIEVGL